MRTHRRRDYLVNFKRSFAKKDASASLQPRWLRRFSGLFPFLQPGFSFARSVILPCNSLRWTDASVGLVRLPGSRRKHEVTFNSATNRDLLSVPLNDLAPGERSDVSNIEPGEIRIHELYLPSHIFLSIGFVCRTFARNCAMSEFLQGFHLAHVWIWRSFARLKVIFILFGIQCAEFMI